MANKIIISFFMLSICCVWQTQAVVNCTSTGAGRYADPADTTCKNYTLCVLQPTTNTYLAYDYVCPSTSLFSPTLRQCTSTYTCPVANTTTTNNTNPATSAATCTADGFVADPNSNNCSSYIQCVSINGTFTETTLICPPTTFYNPNTTFCDANYTCPPATFTCSEVGRFANIADTTCQTYYYCVALANSTLVEYQYTCPTTSLFSPTLRQCTSTYTCPVANTTTTNNTNPATSAATCTADGFVADPNSNNCSSYIQCVSINGTFTETTLTCPPTTFYNPNTTFCDANYTCPPATFTCSEVGRFANTSDTTCQTYYYCVALANSTLVEYQYTCPTTSLFNPVSGLCTATYTCTN